MSSQAVQSVDPFIGVDGAGNCLPGPYLPLGLVRLGPDTVNASKTNGYRSNGPIKCFSHTHVSGTGGGGRFGNIGLTPFAGTPRHSLDGFAKADETASPGYYAVTLSPGDVRAELTCTARTGVHRYRFADGADANVLVDLGAVANRLEGKRALGWGSGASIGGWCEWITDEELVGRGDYRGGWGHEFPYSVHFYIKFVTTPTARFTASAAGMQLREAIDGPNVKAVAHFGPVGQVEVQVGISFVSVANARASVERECGDRSFDDVRTAAEQTWADQFDRIRVTGGTDTQRTLFYTFFSRLMCMPTDLGVDDEFGLWKSGVRHFSEFYCLWDSVRNANSLIGLFDPQLETDFLKCLLDIADKLGWLPDAWITGHSAAIQGGSSADILLCEAALKGYEGIDYQAALEQMRKNNEVISPDPTLYGRHLKDWLELGFLSTNVRKNCVSRSLEYGYQDWCIGRLAEHLGQDHLAERYYESSMKIWSLWRDDLKVFGPRRPDGQWVNPYDPSVTLPDSWNDPYFYEGRGIHWSLCVHHDFAGLITRHGGPEAFVEHLESMYAAGFRGCKEFMLHVPLLFTYAGRPDLASYWIRATAAERYTTKRDGLPDNEDMGCQSAFYMCQAIGLYPIMGQDLYMLTAPQFETVEITQGAGGPVLRIEAPGASAKMHYIASATLDSKPLDRAWLRHHEIADGATLSLELSDTPTDWGKRVVPPSPMASRDEAVQGS